MSGHWRRHAVRPCLGAHRTTRAVQFQWRAEFKIIEGSYDSSRPKIRRESTRSSQRPRTATPASANSSSISAVNDRSPLSKTPEIQRHRKWRVLVRSHCSPGPSIGPALPVLPAPNMAPKPTDLSHFRYRRRTFRLASPCEEASAVMRAGTTGAMLGGQNSTRIGGETTETSVSQ